MMKKIILINCIVFALFAVSCKDEAKQQKQPKKVQTQQISRPNFDADSAFYFVQKQVDFGPRVAGTKEHKQAQEWLTSKLGQYAANVIVQEAEAKMYNGKQIPISNIIAQFNPDNPSRILLAAHYDTRHVADKDANDKTTPIDGANDGASGTGVLVEIARQLKASNTKLGVDIILFDAEDLGSPEGETPVQDSWCLGSQHWAQNPHVEAYRANYGILLDMVGAKDAVFMFEQYAYNRAAPLYTKTWNTAISLGYDYLFKKQLGGGITDDHVYVMHYRGFPMINIIDYDTARPKGFGDFHHTQNDNMSGIDKSTLKAVGETVLATIHQ